MTAPEDQLEKLEVRSMWEHEALDFTPWLARNLDLLGQELDMELELVQTEKPIGPLFLDILARDVNTGGMVAIENQLELSDIGHLGQLLTYAAGCDAHVAIWIATEFTQEYANALNRLNQWTRDEIKFYGVKVQVVRKPGGSSPEPRLIKVVYPGGWDRDATLPSNPPPPPHVQKYNNFFQPLIDDLIRKDFAERANQYFGHAGRVFPTRISRGIGYASSFEKGYAWVTFNIRMEDNELTKRIYDELLAQRDDIEASIDAIPDAEWQWDRNDRFTFSSISVKQDGTIDDPPETFTATRAWMMNLMIKFKECFDPRLTEIFARLS